MNLLVKCVCFFYRSTLIETLHTVLLGTCKYLLRSFMSKRNKGEKDEILAGMSAFISSGISTKIHGNVCFYYQSFVGRDFKGWMQMAVYIIYPYLIVDQRKVWLLLSKVCNIVLITLFSTFLWGGLQQVF